MSAALVGGLTAGSAVGGWAVSAGVGAPFALASAAAGLSAVLALAAGRRIEVPDSAEPPPGLAARRGRATVSRRARPGRRPSARRG